MPRKSKFLYKDLADRIQGQIENGGYRLAQKLPSLRSLCTSTGYSMTTVLQAYVELENRGIVESRQR
ncbi:MAG: winged helix-turn-helix domain-containing protein, partial [Desulfobacterales bacterium]|nr:winged helix-turn-helix domain-containing protein [Desulfobacterales bacterium]